MNHRLSRSVHLLLTVLVLTGCQIGAPSERPPDSVVWSGRWASDRRGYVNGQVSLRLPDPLQPAGDYRVPAKFESALLLLSKGRPAVESWLDLNVTQDTSPAPDDTSTGNLQLHLVTRGIFGPEQQEVVYEARFDRQDTVIQGTYTSVSPSDQGWFRIERTEPDAQRPADPAEPTPSAIPPGGSAR